MADSNHSSSGHSNHSGGGHHVILSDGMILKVGLALLIGTVITVAVAQVNLGWMNFPVAMLVAAIKGSLVCAFFMGLKWDKRENTVILLGSFVFLAIFIVLTACDLLFRPPGTYTNGKSVAVVAAGPSKFKKPWNSQPELLAKGKELYALQCVSCHGEKGEGNGVAAAALNPKPRNFTQSEGWKAGRKISDVFHTLSNGLNAMPSFGSLPTDDRWSLAHYILSFGSTPPVASNEDLKKAGVVDPSKDDGGMGGGAQALPIEFAIERMAEDTKSKN